MMRAALFASDHVPAFQAFWRERHADAPDIPNPEDLLATLNDGSGAVCFLLIDETAGHVAGMIDGVVSVHPSGRRCRKLYLDLFPDTFDAGAFAEALDGLAAFDRADEIWQIVVLREPVDARVAAILIQHDFVLRNVVHRTEWSEAAVTIVDVPDLSYEFYRGGDGRTDDAIVDLHNRAYWRDRSVEPIRADHLWPGVTPPDVVREYVLAWNTDGQLAAYAEWMVVPDHAVINSIAAARAYWGSRAAEAVGTRAMQRMFDLGRRTLSSAVVSTNAAAYKMQMRNGWRYVRDTARTYVRAFPG